MRNGEMRKSNKKSSAAYQPEIGAKQGHKSSEKINCMRKQNSRPTSKAEKHLRLLLIADSIDSKMLINIDVSYLNSNCLTCRLCNPRKDIQQYFHPRTVGEQLLGGDHSHRPNCSKIVQVDNVS